ncbi:MAG: hypothetical protein SOZ90_04220 [Candidatus Faecousia sp.]|nr:hypothetical protein [Candidatus Faecousia sp.]
MYPTLNASAESRQTQDVFAGYNHNLKIGDNEFYDMRNLTSDVAPVLSPRKARGIYTEAENAQGMIAKDSLCYIDGTCFVMNQYRFDLGLSTEPEDCPKQLISMGAYVIILPDKKYINTADTTDRGSIEAEFSSTAPVTFSPCKRDGTTFAPDYVQSTEPEEPKNMEYWMDTSATPHSLKQWSSGTGMWTSVATTYIKIETTGIGKPFGQYDGVQLTIPDNIAAGTAEQIKALNAAAIVYAKEDDAIVVVGLLDTQTTIQEEITVTRKMPLMDFVIENDNRLWGCRYGLDSNGEVVNRIYACKLGDFKNWDCYMGISTDSYYVNLGSDGQFTGAISHAGYPLFFKENLLHKVYGQIPSNFQVQSTSCRGVQKGCSRSLAIVNEVLYYKARHAICAYDGSLPTEISSALGETQYQNATAAAHGNKYYISMQETVSGEWAFFVYDTAKGLWHKEDGLQAEYLCSCRDELYCATPDGKIITMLGSGDTYEKEVSWMAETGIINASMPERKYLTRIHIRLILEPGSTVSILAQYDSCGEWETLGRMTGSDLRSFTFPVRPRRCDHLRLRIEGNGKAMIFSLSKNLSDGSDKP